MQISQLIFQSAQCVRRLWLFKNFVFRENWVGSKVTGLKTTFFTIFDPIWTHILAPKVQIKNSLNSVSINKKLFTINFITLGLTTLKFLKIISFLPFFDTNWAKHLAQMSFKMWHFYLICLKFPLRCLYNHYLLL